MTSIIAIGDQHFKITNIPEVELFIDKIKNIIDKLPDQYRIDFSGMSEPWVNPGCTDM